MAKVSVIVPVYKVESYLDRCVESVLAQTYRDFELILVDDGSPDNCPAMCDAWAEKDSRIKVIHKENGGLSDARNAGLEWVLANSDTPYIAFLDSDDYAHPKMLQTMLDAMIALDTDLVCCDYVVTNETVTDFPEDVSPKRVHVTSGRDVLENIYGKYFYSQVITAWNKLYKRQLLTKLRYPVGYNSEDAIMSFPLYYTARQVAFIDTKLFYYFQRSDSITNGNNRFGIASTFTYVLHLKFLKDKQLPQLRQQVEEWLCRGYAQQYVYGYLKLKDDRKYVESFKKLEKATRGCWKDVLLTKGAGPVQKLGFFACLLHINWLAKFLFRRYLS